MDETGDITRQVFEQMQTGKREAFDRFFERYTARVLIYINYNMGRQLRKKLEPADILQNLYLHLYKNFESFSDRARARGIHQTLIRMADHELTEAYRFHFKTAKRDARREIAATYLEEKASDETSPSPMDRISAPVTSITQKVVRNEEYQRVMQMLQDLGPLEQYVTVTRVIEGLSTQEIADQLGKSRGAIQMILARVRDKLRGRAMLDGLAPPE